MCKFVLACCVIHNLCIAGGDVWEEEFIEDDSPAPASERTSGEECDETLTDAALKHLGELKRKRIVETC